MMIYDDVPMPDYCPPEFKPLPELPPDYPSLEEQEEKQEQFFFGKKALSFCLAIIAIMSITAGMFIGLYFNERSGASQGRPASVVGGLNYIKVK
jgi:hypothetical protein